MRRDREDELDVADIGGEADAATHGATAPSWREKSEPGWKCRFFEVAFFARNF